jgi:hypothetical protein
MFCVRRLASIVALATVLLASLSAQTPQPSPAQPTPQQQQQKSQPKCTDNGTYVNSKGGNSKATGELLGSAPRSNGAVPGWKLQFQPKPQGDMFPSRRSGQMARSLNHA